jgi:hypothetical protein
MNIENNNKFIGDWYLNFDLCLEYVNNLDKWIFPTEFIEAIIEQKGEFIKKNYKKIWGNLSDEIYNLSLLFTYMVRINAEYWIDDLQWPFCHSNIYEFIYENFWKTADFESIKKIIDLFSEKVSIYRQSR